MEPSITFDSVSFPPSSNGQILISLSFTVFLPADYAPANQSTSFDTASPTNCDYITYTAEASPGKLAGSYTVTNFQYTPQSTSAGFMIQVCNEQTFVCATPILAYEYLASAGNNLSAGCLTCQFIGFQSDLTNNTVVYERHDQETNTDVISINVDENTANIDNTINGLQLISCQPFNYTANGTNVDVRVKKNYPKGTKSYGIPLP